MCYTIQVQLDDGTKNGNLEEEDEAVIFGRCVDSIIQYEDTTSTRERSE